MQNELSIISLIAEASLLVQLVMALLVAISVASWTVIFRKLFVVRDARRATDTFEAEFWRDRDLGVLGPAGTDSTAPFTFRAADRDGRRALIDFVIGAGIREGSPRFGAHWISVQEVK